MKSDLQIAQEAKLKPITEIATSIGIKEDELDLYGKYKAKVSPDILKRLKDRPQAKYIVVTAITPTPLGEGKTVTSIGLGQGLAKIGKKVINTLREPSMGPVFGIKGGAAGGGYSQVVPMEDLNLHFTGDIHAVGAANNLLCAMLDTHLQKRNKLGIDIHNININRVVDISDRALRHIIIGLGGKVNGIPRETGYDITVASEVMAILSLSTDVFDLRKRLGRMTIAYTTDGNPITAEDLKAAGAMTVLLKDALKPNLIQTLEHGPCLMHCGPFANIAHGNNSVLADLIATKLGDYVVTESGFGEDMGFEKMCNIKCRTSSLKVDSAVVVCTIRALKMHEGAIGTFSDLLGYFINPIGAYMPHFTLTSALIGIIPATILILMRKDEPNIFELGIAITIGQVITSVLLIPYFLNILFGLPWGVLIPPRMVAEPIHIFIYTYTISIILKREYLISVRKV